MTSTMSQGTIERVRQEIPALSRVTYLNTGTMGPSPAPVTEAFFRAYRAWQDMGPGDPQQYRKAHEAAEPARAKLAKFLGVRPENLALTGNSTDGVNIVTAGINWQEGDEIIITDQEHPAVYVPWMRLQRRWGVRGLVLWLSDDPSVTLSRLDDLLSDRTRLVLISHVTTMTGLVLPVKEMADLAHSRGALVMLDGAQACGNIPVDIPSTGADSYTMNGHKWLLGPGGTGAVFTGDRVFGDIEPVFVGGGSSKPVNYREDPVLEYQDDARRFEFGTRNWSLYVGLEAALDYLEGAGGISAASARSKALALRAREAFSGIRGVTVVSPSGESNVSGILTIKTASVSGEELSSRLSEMKVITRPVREMDAVRFTFAFFNNEEDVGKAAAALRQIVQSS